MAGCIHPEHIIERATGGELCEFCPHRFECEDEDFDAEAAAARYYNLAPKKFNHGGV